MLNKALSILHAISCNAGFAGDPVAYTNAVT
jgi:hypothetical protein